MRTPLSGSYTLWGMTKGGSTMYNLRDLTRSIHISYNIKQNNNVKEQGHKLLHEINMP